VCQEYEGTDLMIVLVSIPVFVTDCGDESYRADGKTVIITVVDFGL